MPGQRLRPGGHATYIFNGPARLGDFVNTALSGAHLHFNEPFDLRDLVAVDLKKLLSSSMITKASRLALTVEGVGKRSTRNSWYHDPLPSNPH